MANSKDLEKKEMGSTEVKSEEEIKELLKVASYCPKRPGCSWDYTPKK